MRWFGVRRRWRGDVQSGQWRPRHWTFHNFNTPATHVFSLFLESREAHEEGDHASQTRFIRGERE
jgi:hypothetical protein